MLGVQNLRLHWGPLCSLYNNPQTMHYGACYKGGLDLLNTPMQLILKLSIARIFNNLSKVVFYSKKIIIFLLSKLWKQWLYLWIKNISGYTPWKIHFKIMNGLVSREQNPNHQISLHTPVELDGIEKIGKFWCAYAWEPCTVYYINCFPAQDLNF